MAASRRPRAAAASAAGLRPAVQYFASRTEWRWTVRATSSSPTRRTAASSGTGIRIRRRRWPAAVLGQFDLVHNGIDNPTAAALQGPQGVAIDSSGGNDRLYVADSGNSRVLGWADAARFLDGGAADIVIGQPDARSVACNDGVAGGDSNGVGADSLCNPSDVAVDSAGNLYVADANNNRVLEYLTPFGISLADRRAKARAGYADRAAASRLSAATSATRHHQRLVDVLARSTGGRHGGQSVRFRYATTCACSSSTAAIRSPTRSSDKVESSPPQTATWAA